MSKKMSKSAKILRMWHMGSTVEQIVDKLGVSRQYVYSVKHNVKREMYQAKVRTGGEVSLALDTLFADAADHPPSGRVRKSLDLSAELDIPAPTANGTQVGGAHYKALEPQPWDVVHSWGMGFLDGNVIKYVARFRSKGGIEDLQKARHYLDKLIETVGK